MSEKLPPTNTPVSLFGQISRNQREQELEHFINKQYNTFGLRMQNKLNAIAQQFEPQQQAKPVPAANNQDQAVQQNPSTSSHQL
jgi:hypothetical protein